MIRVVDVTQHYGVRPVLRGINLEVPSGEMIVILGPNGMGKTTLLGVMAGVLDPQKGYVEFNGLRRRRSVEAELAIRKKVVYLPDHPWLPKNRTGREYLFGIGRLYEIDDDRLMQHVERLLRVFELSAEGDWPIHSYSNGQQKKIAICGALITEAPFLLLDEPFSGGLDPSGILALKHLLRYLVDTNSATVVMTTPVPELVEELADRIVVVGDGQVLACDTAEGLRRRTECSGALDEVLARLIHPQTLSNIREYFEDYAR
jgi:ABC-type multidrug transport system ATPase subunit